MTKPPQETPEIPEAIADEAAKTTLALNPLVSLSGQDFVDAAQTVFKAAISQPVIAAKQWWSYIGEMAKVATGDTPRAPEPGDKRFNDPAWKSSGVHQRLLQNYLAWGEALNGFVDKVELGDQDKARAKLI